jgi:mycothiol synthase
MTLFTARPYDDPAEAAALAALVAACEAVDQLDQGSTADDLAELAGDPDVHVWDDAQGQPAGFGQLFVDEPDGVVEGRLRIHVRPDVRETPLGDAIIAWGAARMRELGHERGRPARLRSLGRDDIPYRLELLQRNGFTPQRMFLRMVRQLGSDLPVPSVPAGYTLRLLGGEREAAAWTALFNQTFREHWNHFDYTLDDVREWLAAPDYRPDLNLVIEAPGGELCAFCWGTVREGAEGWIDELGTLPAYRRRGLGRALLLANLARMRDTGLAIAKLGVDGESASQAPQLYHAAGFTVAYQMVTLVKPLAHS